MKKENDEITDLFRTRLADAGRPDSALHLRLTGKHGSGAADPPPH